MYIRLIMLIDDGDKSIIGSYHIMDSRPSSKAQLKGYKNVVSNIDSKILISIDQYLQEIYSTRYMASWRHVTLALYDPETSNRIAIWLYI